MSASSGTGTFTQTGGTNTLNSGSALYPRLQLGRTGAVQPQQHRASCRPPVNISALPARSPSRRPAARRPSRCFLISSSGTYLLEGRNFAGQWKYPQPGDFQGQRHGGPCSPPTASSWTSPAAPARTWAPSRSAPSNSLLIVPAGFNPATAFAGNSVLGLTHTLRHHTFGAGRAGIRRIGVDQRSGRLPRNDRWPPPAGPSTSTEDSRSPPAA